MKTKTAPLNDTKAIALVAHDNMKASLCDWAVANKSELRHHRLFATGTTGYKLEAALKMEVHKFISGPLGGDQQIGAKISQGEVDVLIFFWDPFEPLPHDPDVKALLRIAAVWNIPVACNQASADFIISSNFIRQPYSRHVPDYQAYIDNRIEDL